MLVILGGLPGTGKTTLAQELARRLGAVHLRVDSIEGELFLRAGADESAIWAIASRIIWRRTTWPSDAR